MYVGRVIKGINQNVSSPLWLQERLRRCGLRAISPVVDVTNYVMLELGQPLHAFDVAKINGDITVRKARADEKLTLLDAQEIILDPKALVIADDQSALALAGIMGGLDSAVSDQTAELFLEAAFFAPHLIAGRARQYGLHTDSSHRFERGVEPGLQQVAIERASELLLEIVGGEAGPLIRECDATHLHKQQPITLRQPRIEKILGICFEDHFIIDTLQRLGMEVEKKANNSWSVTPPPYRFDISLEVDLIEELARIHRYDAIPEIAPIATVQHQQAQTEQLSEAQLKQLLIARDYHEVISFSFVDEQIQQLICPTQKPICLKNPISPELASMRLSLWPSLLKVLQYNNNRQVSRVRIFETGLSFIPSGEDIIQTPRLAGLVSGPQFAEQWAEKGQASDFYDVKNDVQALFGLSKSDAGAIRFEVSEHPALHSGQAADIYHGERLLGQIGVLHPQVAQQLQLNRRVVLFELDLSLLKGFHLPQYQAISKFPAVRRDLAIVVDEDVLAANVCADIDGHSSEILQDLTLFDVYRGPGVAETQKSFALGLTLQHPSRTLVDDEINALVDTIISSLHERFGATLRS